MDQNLREMFSSACLNICYKEVVLEAKTDPTWYYKGASNKVYKVVAVCLCNKLEQDYLIGLQLK